MSTREPGPGTGQPTGLLVLGMHRSGTSALTRVLSLCGADPGARLLAAGHGNEAGHWEDAYAVEQHDRLLAAFGARWDDPLALPRGWLEGEAGAAAVSEIAAYLADDRATRSPWVVKDPRLCLFAPAWEAAADAAGHRLSAVVMVRHPMEVARSLAARDGLAPGRGLLLWLEYSLAALLAAQRLPAVVVDYPGLLADWRGTVERIARLPGMGALAAQADAPAIAAFLEEGRRHQRAEADPDLPVAVTEAWRVLQDCVRAGRVDATAVAAIEARLAPLRELLHPVLAEERQSRRELWRRVGHAEAALAQEALRTPAALRALEAGVEANRQGLLDAVGVELRRMQEQSVQAQAEAAAQARRAQLAEAIAPRLQQLAEGIEANRNALVEAISQELRRMQEVAAASQQAIAERDARLVEQQRSLSERDARLVEQQRTLSERDARLVEQQRTLSERDARLVEQQRSLSERDARLVEQQRSLSERDARLVEQQRILSDRDALVKDMQRDLATLRFEAENLRDTERQFRRLVNSRSWRWTRPLRVLGRLLRGDVSAADRDRFRQAMGRKSVALPVPAGPSNEDRQVAALASLAAPLPGLPDVFVWAVIDWHFRFQRPQHLARALAEKGHRVFYLSNNFADAAEPGFSLDPLDDSGRLFQVHLNLAGKPPIYFGMPGAAEVEALRASLASLLGWACSWSSVSLVQHPYWSPLVRALPAARVVYDCMDHHGGFENNAPAVIEAEARLVEDADLVVVTSGWLEQEVRPKARAIAMVRNAGEFEFFRQAPAKVFRDPDGRRVIGYYGAIADWFDPALVRAVASAHPEALVLLVGNDTAGVGAALADLPNVRLTGEVPYAELPYWLHGFDVCLLPFRVIPLTLATNPVKVYEYLAAGKPVVSVDLPEMAQFEGLVRVAAEPGAFVAEVSAALAEASGESVPARQAFAAGQTWAHRAQALDDALASLDEPLVSVVVLTYNNLAFTEACLFSIEAYSDYRNLEVIVVDNASTDGSREWLSAWAAAPSDAGHRRRLVLNEQNLGFSAGNNVGLRAATGEVLVLLNNDTYVTPGWVRGLCNHLRARPELGLLGPVTNNIGNEAKLDLHYTDMSGMIAEAGRHTRRHPGALRPLRTAAFFCVAMRREVFERVGEMDEAFGVGFFEDDDYCRRVEQAGLDVACAEDVFVHHHLSASFDALKSDRKRELFERNRAIYEEKWGPWKPHEYR